MIKGRDLEYIDDGHIYLVDGIIVPSITQMLKTRFGGKYDGVNREVLRQASTKGTQVHEAIEKYCKYGEESDLQELHDFKFLQKRYGFEVKDNEVPVILEDKSGQVIAAGRLDIVLEMDGKIGGADIKRTSVLDKDYVGLQLNLYRLAYLQSYGVKWEFLRAIHLRDGKRKFVDLPINEEYTWQFIEEFINGL